MPDETPAYLPYLIETGPYTFNCVYVVMTERIEKPGEDDNLEVTIVPGRTVHLVGETARLFFRRYSRFVRPDPDEGEADIPTTRVVPPDRPTGTATRRPKRRK